MSLLPKELSYLESVAAELAKFPAEEIDEDTDASNLEAVLRERVKGMTLRDAISRLTEDHKLLKRWLKESKSKKPSVAFIACQLMRPGPLARQLLAPPLPPEPTLSIDIPVRWKATAGPRTLTISNGKCFCSIMILDKATFESRQWDANHRDELQRSSKNPWASIGGVWSRKPVKFGEWHGEKFLYVQSGKSNWKAVEYLLEVTGGFVNARLGHESGKDFEETEIEQKLHTLAVTPPKATDSIASTSSC